MVEVVELQQREEMELLLQRELVVQEHQIILQEQQLLPLVVVEEDLVQMVHLLVNLADRVVVKVDKMLVEDQVLVIHLLLVPLKEMMVETLIQDLTLIKVQAVVEQVLQETLI